MLLNRALAFAIVVAAVPSMAIAQSAKMTSVGAQGTSSGVTPTTEIAPSPPAEEGGLAARTPFPKQTFVTRPAGESRLAIKFTDQAKARATADKSVVLATPDDTQELQAIKAQFSLNFRPAIKMDSTRVTELLHRAELYSGKQQPDLLGLMYVDGPDAGLQAAANALVKLNSVEYVYFQTPWRPYGPPLPQPGTCCIYTAGNWNCVLVTEDDCNMMGGVFTGEDDCTGVDCQFECGDPLLASCFEEHAYPYCNDTTCCDLVGTSRPFCVDPTQEGEWDFICVALANFICTTPPGEPDRCETPFNTSCYEAHPAGGCLDSDCCHMVCDIDPFCCSGSWDDVCVSLAFDNCEMPPQAGPTPDFCAYQGYLRQSAYEGQLDGIPANIPPQVLLSPDPLPGYAGEGMSLFDESNNLCDSSALMSPQRYVGIYGLGRELLDVYGVGTVNGARGKNVKVAVIEWAYYQGHEDLNVISEPGQTLIMIPSATHPDHATACLGIINAKEDGKGVTGVAPDAKAYFFPLTSVEDGPRELDAFLNCFFTLGPGDVVSCSFGPSPTNLHADAFANALIGVGTSLGITVCVAAGNSCFNLDNSIDLGDAGAIVVGACTPGRPHCRLVFSNYYRSAGAATSQRVHISAWGELVTSTGGSADLWFPSQNWNRSYTTTFNGTSAATPQIAGVAACLQGLAKQFYGIPLSPNQVRAIISGGAFPQCGITNPADIPGFDPALPCGPDINSDFEANLIGGYVRPRVSAETVLSQTFAGFDASPFVKDLYVVRGNRLYGNKFSLKGIDGNYLILQSLYTNRNMIPSPDFGQPEANLLANKLRYYSTAYTTDMMVRATMPAKNVGTINVSVIASQSDTTAILYTELYDWSTGRWTFVGFDLMGQGGDTLFEHEITYANKFVNQTNRNVYLRVYVQTIGNPNGTFTPQTGTARRIDWVNITAGPEYGQVGTGGLGGGSGN